MKRKFTLIELIVVIVVLGLLAAMALPKVTGIVQNAKIVAMINDKEVLEKTMLLHYLKYDNLPLLNENDDFIVLNNNISLIKMVQAEEVTNKDIQTIYTSLQETLEHYNDSEDNLYRIDLSKANEFLSKKLKYGYNKKDKDFYVYSTKTNNVYYYAQLTNSKGVIQHNEYETSIKENRLITKTKSPILDIDGFEINNKPIIELTTNLEEILPNTLINWTYDFIDEDKEPTKISFILNDVEYDNFNNIPTKLKEGEYTVILKMQDSKGLWSDELTKEFKLEKPIEDNFKDVVYVNEKLGVDKTNSGSKENPYKTFEYALKNVKDNGSIYLEGKITLDGNIDFNNYKKNVNFIGDYKNKGSEFYMPEYNTSKHSFYTRSYKVTFNGIKVSNNRTSAWGETFAYSDDITINNCIFNEKSGNSNVYGKYIFNNCVIESIGSIFSPTTFNNCVFLNSTGIGNYSLGNVTVDKNYNITSSHNWVNAGKDELGNPTNIGVYGGKYPWK